MDTDGFSVINPSVIRPNPGDDDEEQAREDAAELQAIAEGIDRELEELGELEDLGDDDDEDESVAVVRPAFNGQNHVATSTPFASAQMGQNAAENAALLRTEHGTMEQLEILYKARGHEIHRLKEELASLSSIQGGETRQHQHQIALLAGERDRLAASLKHFEDVAKAQSEDNQALRRDVEALKAKLDKSEDSKRALSAQVDSSSVMIQTLQSQLVELQKSDTILRAKKQHEETLRSLKDRHDGEVFNLQQEVDRLASQNKRLDNEVENLRSKVTKSQFDHDRLLIEKSETIKELQERLETSQKRLAQHIAETSSQGYSNVKAMHDRYVADQERYATEICSYQEEVNRLKSLVKRKDEEASNAREEVSAAKRRHEIALTENAGTIRLLQENLAETERKLSQITRESLAGSAGAAVKRLESELEKLRVERNKKEQQVSDLEGRLAESNSKYQNLKRKVKQYQLHCRSKEARHNEQIQTVENEYRTKLAALRDKMQDAYESKQKEVEHELSNIKKFVHEELNRVVYMDSPGEENFAILVAKSEENSLRADDVSTKSMTDQLTRRLQNAKKELLLRKPNDQRPPLSSINNN